MKYLLRIIFVTIALTGCGKGFLGDDPTGRKNNPPSEQTYNAPPSNEVRAKENCKINDRYPGIELSSYIHTVETHIPNELTIKLKAGIIIESIIYKSVDSDFSDVAQLFCLSNAKKMDKEIVIYQCYLPLDEMFANSESKQYRLYSILIKNWGNQLLNYDVNCPTDNSGIVTFSDQKFPVINPLKKASFKP